MRVKRKRGLEYKKGRPEPRRRTRSHGDRLSGGRHEFNALSWRKRERPGRSGTLALAPPGDRTGRSSTARKPPHRFNGDKVVYCFAIVDQG